MERKGEREIERWRDGEMEREYVAGKNPGGLPAVRQGFSYD
jgi:hypothetical protein